MIDVTQLKVLIVDDHFLARQVVTDVMRELNITDVTAVVDGNVARDSLNAAYASDKPFDVVFLDWHVPDLDGFELLRLFRSRREFDATAFVMFTSVSGVDDVMKAINAGANGYIIKPAPKQAISKKMLEMRDWIEKKRNPSG